jgi:FKBP-type peptidyl-prolyl cis-trans isomerase FkpA
MYKILLFPVLIAGLFLCACSKDKTPEEQLKADDAIIVKYLSDHSLTAQKTASGLYYIITTAGSGGHPTILSNVTVDYKGYLTNGSVFDQTSAGHPATFPLANLIPGWQEGIPLLQKSGKGTFLIPSYLGYGTSAQSGIPANSVLIFEITLENFN